MKKLSALIVALSVFTLAGGAFAAAATHCRHLADDCVSVQTTTDSTLSAAEMLP